MKTTQQQRDELREQLNLLSESVCKIYVCGTTTNVDMLALLDDADQCAELEADIKDFLESIAFAAPEMVYPMIRIKLGELIEEDNTNA